MSGAWDESWWSAARHESRTLWRGVEAQHLVSTMQLVDTLEEQLTLEQLLEGSKPPLTRERHDARPLHPLLETPFRYRSPSPSRFRKAGDAGVWYGAEEIETACTELAYWRHRFLTDSDGLVHGNLVVQLTFFQAMVDGLSVDLTAPPWNAEHTAWTDHDDYSACHRFIDACRERGTGEDDSIVWVRYGSARKQEGHCAAVLRADALRMVAPFSPQTWVFKVSRGLVLMEHYDDRLSLELSAPSGS